MKLPGLYRNLSDPTPTLPDHFADGDTVAMIVTDQSYDEALYSEARRLAALILQAHSLTPCRITSTPVSV
jgi:hypothetical protein